MKRKPQAQTDPQANSDAAPPVIWQADEAEGTPLLARCEVCGGEAVANPVEQLCWVCRRLKISAWRDVEQQMPAQE